MRKLLPYFFILLALVVIITGFYGYYLKHMSQQLVDNWLRIEQVSIQQGNIFSSLANSHRILLSSGAIRSVMLFDVQHGQSNEMASYGEYTYISKIPDLGPGLMKSTFDGPYQVKTFIRFKERPNLVAVFRTESPDSLVIFVFVLSILTLIVFGFSLYIQRLARSEEAKRIAIIKTALEDLLEDAPPRQFVVKQIPHILANWNSIRGIFEQLKTKLENSARDRLIAQTSQMLGHDLRAPLGNFEKLLVMPDHEMPRMRGTIRESLNRVYAMIEALRHYELENLIHRSRCFLDFDSNIEVVKSKAECRNIKVNGPTHVDCELSIDKDKVTRSWLNLALNAIEFAKSEISIDVVIEESECLIRVTDDGLGVSDEFLPRLFQRGFTHGKADGTGLGLAYVRQIIRGHGGDVTYRRENGLTVFECRIPNAVVTEGENSLTIQGSVSPVGDVRVKTVVAVRFVPESLNRSVLESLSSLKSENFQFSGEYEGADVVATNDPDLALTAIEDDKEPLEFSSSLQEEAIIDRLKRRFHLV
ncbi:MAG: sensor histidine kinase [Pseudomonadota bacterium]|jgi:signal transduction histidine kinase